jgi:CubicO group peptidase (beta-lactamase class C family)
MKPARRTLAAAICVVCATAVGCSDNSAQGAGGGGDLGVGGGLGAGGSGGASDGGSEPTWDPRFDPFADALRAELLAGSAYGISAAVMENGEVTFAAAFGSRDHHGIEKLRTTSLMQIGSVTKQLTAVGLLQKVDSGQASLDDNLEQLLPALEFAKDPSWDDEVTLRDLLSHSGAFVDDVPWYGWAAPKSDDSYLSEVAYGSWASTGYLMNPPGLFFNYSNAHFSYAGVVTEELDGRAWPQVMQEEVFGPLGMDRTYLRKSDVEEDGDYALSYGFAPDGNGRRPLTMDDINDAAFTRPAGLAWSTPTQMMRWASFLLEGNDTVLSTALRQQLTAEQIETLLPGGTSGYGFGLFIDDGWMTGEGRWYAMPVWVHNGLTLSFSHVFVVLPELDFAVSIAASGRQQPWAAMDVALETLGSLPEPTSPPVVELDPTTFDRHVGTYVDVHGFGDIHISLQGDSLTVDIPSLTAADVDVDTQLVPLANDYFIGVIDGGLFDLTFIPAEPGSQSVYLRNRVFVATRADTTMMVQPIVGPPSPSGVEETLRRLEQQPPLPPAVQARLAAQGDVQNGP